MGIGEIMFEYTQDTESAILAMTIEQRDALVMGALRMHESLEGGMTFPECIDAYVKCVQSGEYEFIRNDGILYVRGV